MLESILTIWASRGPRDSRHKGPTSKATFCIETIQRIQKTNKVTCCGCSRDSLIGIRISQQMNASRIWLLCKLWVNCMQICEASEYSPFKFLSLQCLYFGVCWFTLCCDDSKLFTFSWMGLSHTAVSSKNGRQSGTQILLCLSFDALIWMRIFVCDPM